MAKADKAEQDRRYLLLRQSQLEQQIQNAKAVRRGLQLPRDEKRIEHADELIRLLEVDAEMIEFTIEQDRKHRGK